MSDIKSSLFNSNGGSFSDGAMALLNLFDRIGKNDLFYEFDMPVILFVFSYTDTLLTYSDFSLITLALLNNGFIVSEVLRPGVLIPDS